MYPQAAREIRAAFHCLHLNIESCSITGRTVVMHFLPSGRHRAQKADVFFFYLDQLSISDTGPIYIRHF